MKIGSVGSGGDALVRLSVRAPGPEQERVIEAILDTGFNGFLALPPGLIEALGLQRTGRAEFVTASGAKHYPGRYEATVVFGGEAQVAEIVEAAESLVGAALLWGYELLSEAN